MSTENENWRDDSSSEENSGNRFERENNYSRPSYNREGGDRPYRPRFNSESGERPQRAYSSDRPLSISVMEALDLSRTAFAAVKALFSAAAESAV